MWLFKLTVFFGIMATFSSAKKILIIPVQMPSHVSELTAISQGLMGKGHDVYMVMGKHARALEIPQKSGVKLLLHEMSKDKISHKPDFKGKVLSGKQTLAPLNDMRAMPLSLKSCTELLSDRALYEKLQSMAFDFAVIDGLPFGQCAYILLYKLDLPYATFTVGADPCQMGSPLISSFIPFVYAHPRSDHMDFWERLQNTWDVLDWCWDHRMPATSIEMVKKFAPEKPLITIDEMARKSKLWLMDTDIVLDYARPTMPNEVNVGGLTLKDGEPLPENFKAIVESAQHGVIVMSFGTSAPDINEDKFVEAFGKVKQEVIWRYKGDAIKEDSIPANVHIFKWIPQAALLAHPNVKLFITHCGANGQFEGVYNGVPMLQFPVFAEQPYNALRAKRQGYGLTLSISTVTSSLIIQNINELINNPSYKEKVTRASQIMKGRSEKPVERAVNWIEHVMTYGADHLMAHSLQMPFYQLVMLDILALVLGVLITGLLVIRCLIKFLCRLCCGGGSKKVKVN